MQSFVHDLTPLTGMCTLLQEKRPPLEIHYQVSDHMLEELRLLSVLYMANIAVWGKKVSTVYPKFNHIFTYNAEENRLLGISQKNTNNGTSIVITLKTKQKFVLPMYCFLKYFSVSHLSKKRIARGLPVQQRWNSTMLSSITLTELRRQQFFLTTVLETFLHK